MLEAVNVTPIEQEIVTGKHFATVPWVAETDFHGSRGNQLTIRDQAES